MPESAHAAASPDASSVTPLPFFMSPRDVGQFLGVSMTLVYRMLDERVIESTRVGGRRFVLRSSLHDYVEALTAREA